MTNARPSVEQHVTAFLDNEDSEAIANPIHSTAYARRHGFSGPLVGGVTVWGWSVPAILDALGETWLDRGWAQFRFRQPIYPNDEVAIRLQPGATGEFSHTMTNQEGVDCVVGAVGLGDAPFLPDLVVPGEMTPAPSPEPKPDLVLDPALAGRDWTPESVGTDPSDLIAYATASHRSDDPRFVGERPRIHPAWLASRAERVMRHNWSLPQSIHTESQIQFLAPAHAGVPVRVGARCVDVFERKGRHLVRFDCLVRSESGVDLAHMRHTTIFKLGG